MNIFLGNSQTERDPFFCFKKKKRKSYLPNHCTFQFELGIPRTNTSGL